TKIDNRANLPSPVTKVDNHANLPSPVTKIDNHANLPFPDYSKTEALSTYSGNTRGSLKEYENAMTKIDNYANLPSPVTKIDNRDNLPSPDYSKTEAHSTYSGNTIGSLKEYENVMTKIDNHTNLPSPVTKIDNRANLPSPDYSKTEALSTYSGNTRGSLKEYENASESQSSDENR
ncbi:hypothetical protein BC936DRAFT_144279, partial [Jimgerdemannia flammicorona]